MRLIAVLLCLILACSPVGSAAQQPDINRDYSDAAARIIGSAMVDKRAYERLQYLCDRIGHRLSGSVQLEQAVEWALATMKADGLENVRAEKVMVPHWVRGAESATMISPSVRPLTMLGLGGTVGTPPEGIAAEVVAVRNYQELEALGENVKGKIVLYNAVMRSDLSPGSAYGDAVEYRVNGASKAAKLGASGMLLRSVTTRSLNTPHTGSMIYAEDAPKIPAAALTVEDADLIYRLVRNGEKVVVRMNLGAKTLPDAESANVIAELRGREKPDEIVLIGGHLDSWDVGTGAHDDGAGCVMVMEAARLLAKLNLRPRRTIRVVLFTNEENGLRGAKAYAEAHREEFSKHVAAIESDSGVARPLGFLFSGKDRAYAVVEQIATLLQAIDAGEITRTEGAGADISVLTKEGVPGFGFRPDPTHYFDFHHTPADTFDKIDRRELALNVATIAVMAFVLADLPEPLPRD